MDAIREIKYWNHTEGLYLTPHYIMSNQIQDLIRSWKESVRKDCLYNDAEHYIYQTTIYDKDMNILEIHLYATPVKTDDDFEKRIKAATMIQERLNHTIYFGVWHKGTSYEGLRKLEEKSSEL